MPKCLVFSTVTDYKKRAVAFKHWVNVERDYKTAIAYTGFDYDREEELDRIANYFFNTSEKSNVENFLTFYNYFLDDKKHNYDYYFLIESNLLFPNYFLREFFKEVISKKIDVSSPVYEKTKKYKKLRQQPSGRSFDVSLCSNEAVCLSKRAAKKLNNVANQKQVQTQKIKFDTKTFDKLTFSAINFTPIKYV